MEKIVLLLACLTLVMILGCSKEETAKTQKQEAPSVAVKAHEPMKLSDEQVDNLVRRSYQYVAMYNVNDKFAIKQGGWNTCDADTKLKDHTMREIARPNNDTLYISCMLDLRKDLVILEMPAFDSKYVSLMVTGYDYYVNVPLTTRLGDFRKPEKMLFYTARTEGYKGEPVKGIDRRFEATGDFLSAVFRVMPHANDPQRFKNIVKQMQSVKLVTRNWLSRLVSKENYHEDQEKSFYCRLDVVVGVATDGAPSAQLIRAGSLKERYAG